MKRKAISRTALWIIIAVVVIVAVVGGVAAWYATRPPPPTPTPTSVTIGIVAPLTGSMASWGTTYEWLVPYIQNYINQNMGGIYMPAYGKKIPVNIILMDDQSSPSQASAVATQLATQYHVNLLIASEVGTESVAATSAGEKYGVPTLAVETAVEPWIAGAPSGGWHWAYATGESFAAFAYVYPQIWNAAREEYPGQVNNVVAVWSTSDADGEEFQSLITAVAAADGYQVVNLGTFAPGTTDFTSAILKAKAANATILTGLPIPPDFTTFWKQAHTLGWVPKVATVGRAYLFPSDITAQGDSLGFGLASELWWYPTLNYTDPILGISTLQWAYLYEEKTGQEWNPSLGFLLEGMDVAVYAIEHASSLSPQALNQSLANVDTNTIMGPVKMGSLPSYVQQIMAQYEPNMLQPQNLGHYAVFPPLGGQWVPNPQWPSTPWTIVPVYVPPGMPSVTTYPIVLIPATPTNATPPYTPPSWVPP
ncbi:MAG: ABC transporter substrate-binding protein [Nitrososphaeria archaeon]